MSSAWLPQTPSQPATRIGDLGRKVLALGDPAGVQGSAGGSQSGTETQNPSSRGGIQQAPLTAYPPSWLQLRKQERWVAGQAPHLELPSTLPWQSS